MKKEYEFKGEQNEEEDKREKKLESSSYERGLNIFELKFIFC